MVERKKERNLRTSDDMRTLFLLGSVAGVVCGARHVLNYLNEQQKIPPQARARRHVGARRRRSAVHLRRTAQQVSPR